MFVRLRSHRGEPLHPALARIGRRLVKLLGDGTLAEFPSAVAAVRAAIEFQQQMAEDNRGQPEGTRIVFRVGLHLDDLIVEGDDPYGGGVNIAARLEAEAPAGGIVLSRTVHEAMAGRPKATFNELGAIALKNIERLFRTCGALLARGLTGLPVLLTLAIQGAVAQDASKTTQIGWLNGGSQASSQSYAGAFREGLARAGLVEGRNLIIDFRFANGQLDRLDALAIELVSLKPALIVAGGDQAISAVKRATRTIPIVGIACDALAAGLVSNLARPGENLTGVTCIDADLAGKRVELFREALPSLSKLGVMLNRADSRMEAELREIQRSVGASVAVQPLDVRLPSAIGPAFEAAAISGLGGVAVVFDTMTFFDRKLLAEAALLHRIPTTFNFRQYVEAGGLMSYGPNLADMYRQSANHVAKVLKGERPGEIPMEQPTRFELVVNLKTAAALGVILPANFIARADEVIE